MFNDLSDIAAILQEDASHQGELADRRKRPPPLVRTIISHLTPQRSSSRRGLQVELAKARGVCVYVSTF